MRKVIALCLCFGLLVTGCESREKINYGNSSKNGELNSDKGEMILSDNDSIGYLILANSGEPCYQSEKTVKTIFQNNESDFSCLVDIMNFNFQSDFVKIGVGNKDGKYCFLANTNQIYQIDFNESTRDVFSNLVLKCQISEIIKTENRIEFYYPDIYFGDIYLIYSKSEIKSGMYESMEQIAEDWFLCARNSLREKGGFGCSRKSNRGEFWNEYDIILVKESDNISRHFLENKNLFSTTTLLLNEEFKDLNGKVYIFDGVEDNVIATSNTKNPSKEDLYITNDSLLKENVQNLFISHCIIDIIMDGNTVVFNFLSSAIRHCYIAYDSSEKRINDNFELALGNGWYYGEYQNE